METFFSVAVAAACFGCDLGASFLFNEEFDVLGRVEVEGRTLFDIVLVDSFGVAARLVLSPPAASLGLGFSDFIRSIRVASIRDFSESSRGDE